ncbi:hypothetical protein ENUP19_0257G0049 [Entamoeba nuttalli]|uniref:Longin domain-containing protein n=2 Tax=Entamoeba nuttalli TaxID=412467 RepID=K2HQP7_ENTNP|nr:hypothetical protein ENU1_172360 [Entamoeba nuttalli P19]EKE38265.1 hypothetical protein ENU1_172360 [Entamoeba nuttalli P19]|eukprot:XP_008859417.1 hypothetical protein ENU1_172360 [Entamoeba nuttalli P19]
MAEEKIALIQKNYNELEYDDNILYGGIVIKYQHVCETVIEGQDLNKQKSAVEKIIGQLKRKEEQEQVKSFEGQTRTIYVLQNGLITVILVCNIRFPPKLAFATMKNIYSFFYSTFKKTIDGLNSHSFVNIEEFDSFRPKLLDFIMKANNDETDETRVLRKKTKNFYTTTEVSVRKIGERGKKVADLEKQADTMKQASSDLSASAVDVRNLQRCKYWKRKSIVIILLVVLVLGIIGIIIGVCFQFIPRGNNSR